MIRNNPVSVVIPTYNRAHLLGRALRSVLDSCRPGDEVIVVDDGSTDDTRGVIARFGDRVRYLAVANGGAGRARNMGIAAASHDMIAFLDSDDEWIPGSLEAKRRYMDARPDTLFCFSDFISRLPNGVEERNYLREWHKDSRSWSDILGPGVALGTLVDVPGDYAAVPVHEGSLYLPEMKANYVFASVLMVRKSAAGDALHFWEEVPWCEDWACYARLAAMGRAAYLDCHMAWQHGHDGPRISGTDPFIRNGIRIQMLEAIWGSDADFLRHHGEEYQAVLRSLIQFRVRASLARGKTTDARELLKRAGRVPFLWEMLARIPQPLAQMFLLAKKGNRKVAASVIYATMAAELLSDGI